MIDRVASPMLPDHARRRLMWHGVFVLVLSLIVGFVVRALTNPRMGPAGDVGGAMSGTLLIVVGLIWGDIKLPASVARAAFWLFVYAAYTGWLAQFLAGLFGTSLSMPIGGAGFRGTAWQEGLVGFVAVSFSFAILVASLLALWGLRRDVAEPA